MSEISLLVQPTIQCVFLAYFNPKEYTLKSKHVQFSHFYVNQLYSADTKKYTNSSFVFGLPIKI